MLIDGAAERRAVWRQHLEARGLAIAAEYDTPGDAAASTGETPGCDLAVLCLSGSEPAVLAGVRRLAEAGRVSILALTETDDPAQIQALTDAGADLCLPIRSEADHLGAAIGACLGFRQRLASVEAKVAGLEQALNDRKLVERAKGILMTRSGMSEPDAFRHIQLASMQRNQRMSEMARAIIEGEEIPG